MGKKFYAVIEGYDFASRSTVKNKIVNTWDECVKYVNGVKGAKYKSFATMQEAEAYLENGEVLMNKGQGSMPLDQYHCYVDGSFNEFTGKYSYALVIVKDDVIVYIENGSAENSSQKDIRQIGGELKAAVRAAEYCRDGNIKEFVILHDYAGVCYHATGFWERREESSRAYFDRMQELMKKNDLIITFVKVDSHTGDLYNEIADEMAKAAGGVTVKGETRKNLKNKSLMVSNKEIKESLLEIAGEDCSDKIIIVM